jgi:hypothetical protein
MFQLLDGLVKTFSNSASLSRVEGDAISSSPLCQVT